MDSTEIAADEVGVCTASRIRLETVCGDGAIVCMCGT